MSTFDGFVEEFPDIQIDYFRKNSDRPPLACFLSHVHSDHLQGLESFRAPFIYCSPATRELLLRIEKYPHRMNFNKGVLETRRLHYKHLYKLLRPIPLNTPTEIELTPRLSIRVTLLDANHCAGAVMFLIEGNGKAILYTGDIRAESWWVNSLIRNPILIPYTLGSKRLDKLYLDTTFARSSHVYREFPPKAEGLAELLRKVEQYPTDTTFYFRSWTFGYEDVWLALSAALHSKVHVDRYQLGLYRALSEHTKGSSESASLAGFDLGNRFVSGCLTSDEKACVHSCEPGTQCVTIKSDKVVYIFPIVNRLGNGFEIMEVGHGGGGGDLYQTHELELPDQSALEGLESLCLERIHDGKVVSRIRDVLAEAFRSRSRTLSLDSYGMKDNYDIPLERLVSILNRGQSGKQDPSKTSASMQSKSAQPLPNIIHFPYARHSSYTELRELVSAFKPKDIYPCTIDHHSWTEDMSMETLFGDLCSSKRFTHDAHMRDILYDLRSRKKARYDEDPSQQSTQQSSMDQAITDSGPSNPETNSYRTFNPMNQRSPARSSPERIPTASSLPLPIPDPSQRTEESKRTRIHQARQFLKSHPESETFGIGSLPWSSISNSTQSQSSDPVAASQESKGGDTPSFESRDSGPPNPDGGIAARITAAPLSRSNSSRIRREAYLAAKADSYDAWSSVSLLSAGNNHTEEETEL